MFSKNHNNRGLILVVTLWIVAILVLLAIGLAYRVSLELHLVKFSRNRLKTRLATEASAQLAAVIIASDTNDYDSPNEFWSTGLLMDSPESFFKDIKLKEASFSIRHRFLGEDSEFIYGLSDEDSKLNLNTATLEQLVAFFSELDIDNPREIAASILDWIDQDEITSFDGAEDDYYSGLDPSYHCKNAPIAVIEELLLIKGMDAEKFKKIKPLVTVYGDGKININTVSELVLRSLLISRGTLDTTARKLAREIVEFRAGEDNKPSTADDKSFSKFEDIVFALSSPLSLGEFAKCVNALKFKSDFFQGEVQAIVPKTNVRTRVTFILKKDQRGLDKAQLVFWQEE